MAGKVKWGRVAGLGLVCAAGLYFLQPAKSNIEDKDKIECEPNFNNQEIYESESAYLSKRQQAELCWYLSEYLGGGENDGL